MFRASSRIETGSPMSRTNTCPDRPIEPACTISDTASGIVMKKRVISGWVTRDRAAALDLAAEDRDHAPGRAEHVAEADGDEAASPTFVRAP